MAMQPCTVGEMQAYVDGQIRDMRAYVDGRAFLTVERANTHVEQHLRDQRYITSAELRGLGYAPTAAVKEDFIAVVQRENQLVADLKSEMQQLFDRTRDMQTGFEQQAAAATASIDAIQAQMTASFEQRSTQLQDHVDSTQRSNIASLDLLNDQLNNYTNGKQAELLSHCSSSCMTQSSTTPEPSWSNALARCTWAAVAARHPLARVRPVSESCSMLGITRFRSSMLIQAWALHRDHRSIVEGRA